MYISLRPCFVRDVYKRQSNKLSDYYGSHVFDRKKMQEYLPKEAYKAVTDAIEKGTPVSYTHLIYRQ